MKVSAGKSTPSESAYIAEQLRRAFDGNAWHGPALLELLEDLDAATALAKPVANVHSIWELVLHTAVWDRAVRRRIMGVKTQPDGKQNFPPAPKTAGAASQTAWRKAISTLIQTHDALIKTVSALPASRLRDRVPGKRYNISFMLYGVLQHEIYHAGQIAVLKKARARPKK